jgi:ATP-dependent DNA ligase
MPSKSQQTSMSASIVTSYGISPKLCRSGTLRLALGEFPLPLDLPPMEARSHAALPTDDGPWQFEPKWDGFRCLAFKRGSRVALTAKSGRDLGRYFPEVVDLLAALDVEQFVVDGELVVAIDGQLSFDALQMRLHPAESRIKRLARETPARLIVFDMLAAPDGAVLLDLPLSERRRQLLRFMKLAAIPGKLELSPAATDIAQAEDWLARSGGGTDGVVAKALDGPYEPGIRAMIKVKHLRSADCVVGGFRYAVEKPEVASLLLGLYDEKGLLDHVGFTSGIGTAERRTLTAKLERLRTSRSFTGKAPGGPSRWTTDRSAEWVPVKPDLVVEVRFDHVTARRFRHGTKLLRWRPDKRPDQCTFEQIAPVERMATKQRTCR